MPLRGLAILHKAASNVEVPLKVVGLPVDSATAAATIKASNSQSLLATSPRNDLALNGRSMSIDLGMLSCRPHSISKVDFKARLVGLLCTQYPLVWYPKAPLLRIWPQISDHFSRMNPPEARGDWRWQSSKVLSVCVTNAGHTPGSLNSNAFQQSVSKVVRGIATMLALRWFCATKVSGRSTFLLSPFDWTVIIQGDFPRGPFNVIETRQSTHLSRFHPASSAPLTQHRTRQSSLVHGDT